MLPNAQEAGIHDLQGTDPIWAGVIISDRFQDQRAMYSGVQVPNLSWRDSNLFIVDDERHDPSLEKLIDIGLYDRWGDMVRSTPEERAMRYLAVCTSMLADQVKDLEEGNKSSTKKFAEVKGPMGALEVQQAKLNDKVTLLEWDFSLNLKYCSQVINFKAQMLSFSLTESVMDHQERVQQDCQVQEQFGLQQDWISGMEEMLQALSTKVSSCSTWVDRLKLTGSFSRLTFLILLTRG